MSVKRSIDKLIREVAFKGITVVDGNILDKFYKDGKLYDLTSLLIEKISCFNEIFVWDRIVGTKNGSLDKLIINNSMNTKVTNDFEDDFGEFEETETDIKSTKNLLEFSTILYETIATTEKKYLFLIDFSDQLFSGGNSYTEEEKQAITLLTKAIKERKHSMAESSLGSSIIFITNNIAKIPMSFYQNNPDANLITISKPDRLEREEFFRERHDFYYFEESLTEEENLMKLVDYTDDFTIKELIQLSTLSQNERGLSIDKIMTLYKFGEHESEWEKLTSNKVKTLKRNLEKRVKGQNRAIEKIYDIVVRAKTGLSGLQHSKTKAKPKGTLFFSGPTGVGKTELAKSLAEFLFGDESACIRFDMSEYSQEHSDQKLIGAPPGYVGYESGGLLTNTLKERPFCVLLFDEIEKAHPRILDKFLQILEDGRLTDNKGDTVYFSETIIIFTSNIGANDIQANKKDEEIFNSFKNSVINKFHEINRPELLGRIGYNNIVPFNFIKDEKIKLDIAEIKLKPLTKYLKDKYGYNLKFKEETSMEEILRFIVSKADVQKGGRDILNCIENNFINNLSNFIFENEDVLFEDCDIYTSFEGEKIIFEEE